MLTGLVKAGFRTTVMELARRIGYKPLTPAFFEILRWKQKQAGDGRRAAESWPTLSETQICENLEELGLLSRNHASRLEWLIAWQRPS